GIQRKVSRLHRIVTSCESLGTESTIKEIKATDPQDTVILIQIDLTTSVSEIISHIQISCERYLLEKEITLTVWCQDEEKHRNSRICNMLFIETSHCLADFIFSLGNHSLQLSDRERIDVKLNFTSDLRFIHSKTVIFGDTISVIEVFEESEGRKHGECSLLDLATVLEIKKKLCEANILLNFSRRFQSEAEGKPVEIKEANCREVLS
ncbi:unnamed protein product, partial [Brassica rapa]